MYSVTSPSVSGGDELPEPSNEMIGFHNARFTWSASSNHTSGPVNPRRNFTLRAEGDIFFKHGVLNLVVGPTGSGKTSLLLALLGEMHFTPNGVDAWYYLPRDKGIAYCPQEAWLLNDTIRVSAQVDTRGQCTHRFTAQANILFDQEFDETRYKEGNTSVNMHFASNTLRKHPLVLRECALDRDLSLFEVSSLGRCGIRRH